jgi:hypothetical protein
MMKRLMVLGLSLVAGIGLAVTIGHVAVRKPLPLQARAHWKDLYRTPAGLVAGADLIVIAEHVSAEPGRVVGEGEDATPFTNNTFRVQELLKGEHNGTSLVVEQTGGLLPTGVVLSINDGGPYEQGRSYLLFLKDRGDGVYYVINHQARYLIEEGLLQGVDPADPVVASINGQALAQVRGAIRERVRLLQ